MPQSTDTPVVLTRFFKILAVALVTAALTYALRTLLIEPRHIHEQCVLHTGSVLCAVRQVVVMGFVLNLYAIASVALGLCAMALRSRHCAWAAVILGVVGALLYRIELAALGLLFGALVATRAPVAPQHSQRHP